MEILAVILVLLGLIGSILPVLPGPPLSFAGLFIYAYVTGFEKVGSSPLIIFGTLSLISVFIDYFAPTLGVKSQKASKRAALGAIAGSFLGLVLAGYIGLFIGPLIGAFFGEYSQKRDFGLSVKSAVGAFGGFLVGTVVRVLIAISITIYFFYILMV